MKRKQAASKKIKCDICKQLVFARGLKSHVRLLHKLVVTETTKVTSSLPVVTQVVTQVMTQVKPKSAKKLKEPIIKPSKDLTQVVTQVEKPTQVVTQVVTEVVTQVVEKKRTYTPYPADGNFIAVLDWHSKNNPDSNTLMFPEHDLNNAALKLGKQLAAIDKNKK